MMRPMGTKYIVRVVTFTGAITYLEVKTLMMVDKIKRQYGKENCIVYEMY